MARNTKESREYARDRTTRAAAIEADGGPQPPESEQADPPGAQPGIDGHDPSIGAAVTALLGRSVRDPVTGRFVRGQVKTGKYSATLWEALAPIKADIVGAVRHQLGADRDDAPPTLLALIDAYAEASLLRRSTFLQLVNRGGPVTTKGRTRGLLAAWGAFFDRELRAAERLGLVNVPRQVDETPAAWLARLADERRKAEAAAEAPAKMPSADE